METMDPESMKFDQGNPAFPVAISPDDLKVGIGLGMEV